MGNVEQLPNPAQIEREAADWLARLNAPDVSIGDRECFARWLEAHPSHARTYYALRATWQRFERAGAALASAPELASATHVERRPRMLPAAGLAAALLVAIASLWWWLNAAAPAVNLQLRTGIGQQAALPLPDGSAVMLNTNSAVSVTYAASQRVVALERGEAHFSVAADPRRPFWVTAGGKWVRAVGTEFDVSLAPQGVDVLVTEGQVKVAAATAAQAQPSDHALALGSYSLLAAGQKIEFRGSQARLYAMSAHDWRRSQAWRAGKLEFDDQSLDAVIAELGRYTTSELVIDDARLRGVRFGGTFKANDEGVRTVLNLLQQGWGVELRREPPNRVHLSRADGSRRR